MRFQLVPKSTTLDLDDLEPSLRTLFQNVFFKDHQENLNEERPILSAAKM